MEGAKICAAETHLDNPPQKTNTKPPSFAIPGMFSAPTPIRIPLAVCDKSPFLFNQNMQQIVPPIKITFKNVLNLAGLSLTPCYLK